MAGRRVAGVGLEIDGSNALLRSLYTEPLHRGRGIGRELVGAAEAEATALGADSVYLFSTDAGAYFRALGYVEIPVPEAVAALRTAPQVAWYRAHPELLAGEVTFRKTLAPRG